MRSNPAMMRTVIGLAALAMMPGGLSTADEYRPTPEYLKRREERRQREREQAAIRDATRLEAANAKRARKALKLAALAARDQTP